MHYSGVVMILLNTGLYKSVFSTYSFKKFFYLFFVFLCFDFSCFCISGFYICFEFSVTLNDLITFTKSASVISHVLFNFVLFVLTLYKELDSRENHIRVHTSEIRMTYEFI